jgi:hypothetical protein
MNATPQRRASRSFPRREERLVEVVDAGKLRFLPD